MNYYDFRDKLAQGQQGEKFLDAFFAERYEITPASDADQRNGIDRWFVRRGAASSAFAVEYKTDTKAASTKNAFLETVSVDTAGKGGWAFRSQALRLVYYVPGLATIYVIKLDDLRRWLPVWIKQYAQRSAANVDYTTHGIVVPLVDFQRIAEVVILTWGPMWIYQQRVANASPVAE